MKHSWKKHLSTTNYTFKTKIRIFHQNHGLSLKGYQLKTSSTSSFTAYNGVFFYFQDSIGKKNVFYDILERKNVSLSCKNKKLKKSKTIETFPKRLLHGFRPKLSIYPSFYFRHFRPGKYLIENTHFKAIKTTSYKSRKIEIFPKGLTHRFGQKMAIFPTFF